MPSDRYDKSGALVADAEVRDGGGKGGPPTSRREVPCPGRPSPRNGKQQANSWPARHGRLEWVLGIGCLAFSFCQTSDGLSCKRRASEAEIKTPSKGRRRGAEKRRPRVPVAQATDEMPTCSVQAALVYSGDRGRRRGT